VRERIEYRFRVPSAAVFTLYSYSKVLEYRFRVPTAAGLMRKRKMGEGTGGRGAVNAEGGECDGDSKGN
jgi:hypothetical protein